VLVGEIRWREIHDHQLGGEWWRGDGGEGEPFPGKVSWRGYGPTTTTIVFRED
jgi:hypothetical protein